MVATAVLIPVDVLAATAALVPVDGLVTDVDFGFGADGGGGLCNGFGTFGAFICGGGSREISDPSAFVSATALVSVVLGFSSIFDA